VGEWKAFLVKKWNAGVQVVASTHFESGKQCVTRHMARPLSHPLKIEYDLIPRSLQLISKI
jgi:hypothetical protein